MTTTTARLSLFAPGVTADQGRRLILGTIVRYGVLGQTSSGPLRVRAGALQLPSDAGRVKLTDEHDRTLVTGYLATVDDTAGQLAGAFKIASTPEGDRALQLAGERVKDGLSIDIDQVSIDGDEIVAARLVAVGQVAFPAFDDSRIASVAASAPVNPEGNSMSTPTPAASVAAPSPQAAAPAAVSTPDPSPDPAPAMATVAASLAAVPAGVPTPAGGPARTSQAGALAAFVDTVTAALAPGGGGAAAITAALTDVTSADHTATIEAPAWSGELWSGVQYEAEFTPLLSSGTLTNWEGRGWRWVTKPEMQDYAGNKAAIPTDEPVTEDASYTAARMAVGHDIDRKFYDFPNAAFLQGYVEAVRESWAIKLDDKVEAWIADHATPVLDGVTPVSADNVLKAAALAIRALKRRRVGRATFVLLSDEDFDTLFDVTNDDVPAFLKLWNVDPSNFTSSDRVDSGQVVAGAKQSATVRTLPGSPIRVDAQHLANGGIDNAFFGYWAIEEHHTGGIAAVTFDPTP